MSINRREFVRRSVGTGLALGTSLAPSASYLGAEQSGRAEGEPLPIVDTHQHLWDLSKFRLPWITPGSVLDKNFLTAEYLEATEGLNVVKAVYMEVAVAADQKLAEAEYILDLCRRKDTPTVAAVIGGEPGSDDFRQYITRFKDSPYIKGLRRPLRSSTPGQPFRLERKFVEGVRLLGELGMHFDLNTPPAGLTDGVKLVDQCPHTRFVLNHCGNADPTWFRQRGDETGAEASARRSAHQQWRRDIATLAQRERVVCKISGIVSRAPQEDWTPDDLAPIINHCIDVFGPDRVMFASDWPVCTRVASLRQWVEALKEVIKDRDTRFKRKLLHDNAMRFYRLS